MNKYTISKINTLYILSLLTLILISCGEDRRKEYHEETKIDRWIEKEMRQNYYWYQDMPPLDQGMNFFSPPEKFFASLLSHKDGKKGKYHYSYIENLTHSETRSLHNPENSYGFEFANYINGTTRSNFLRVLYVVSNSPAEKAGLRRGDWIININGEKITNEWTTQLANGGSSLELQLAEYLELEEDWVLLPTQKITLSPSIAIEDNPVFAKNIITVNNTNVGYLAYNHFTPGKKEEDQSYDNQLRQLSKEFKSKNVTEFVLDLRYNNGGYLSSAALLCEILAHSSSKGQIMYYLQYNDKYKKKETQFFDHYWLGDGVNLNLDRVYVLVSNASASASEMVINCLHPYMDVILIGEQTEGKNVGSTTYTHEEGEWAIHPIICEIQNAEEFSDYAKGFTPNYPINELDYKGKLHDLGNPKELLFKEALSIISGKEETRSPMKDKKNKAQLKVQSLSLDRKFIPIKLPNNSR